MASKYSLDDLTKLIEQDKLDELEHATKNMSPEAVRANLSNALGQHIEDNYDLGLDSAISKAKKLEARPLLQRAAANAYEEAPEINVNKLLAQKIQKPVKLKIFNKPGAELGFMNTGDKNPLIHLNEAHLEDIVPSGVVAHEGGHISDMVNKGFIPEAEEALINKLGGMKGLKAAEQLYGKHHGGGFFELEALKKLTKNKLLSKVPVIGGALGAYQMLDSGDLFAADPTGMLSSDAVGEGSDVIPQDELGDKQKLNNRMKKMRAIMEGK